MVGVFGVWGFVVGVVFFFDDGFFCFFVFFVEFKNGYDIVLKIFDDVVSVDGEEKGDIGDGVNDDIGDGIGV